MHPPRRSSQLIVLVPFNDVILFLDWRFPRVSSERRNYSPKLRDLHFNVISKRFLGRPRKFVDPKPKPFPFDFHLKTRSLYATPILDRTLYDFRMRTSSSTGSLGYLRGTHVATSTRCLNPVSMEEEEVIVRDARIRVGGCVEISHSIGASRLCRRTFGRMQVRGRNTTWAFLSTSLRYLFFSRGRLSLFPSSLLFLPSFLSSRPRNSLRRIVEKP